MIQRLRRWVVWVMVLSAGSLVVFAVLGLWWINRPMPRQGDSIELSVELGQSPRDVAKAWVDAGVQTSPWLLYQWFRVSGQARGIRAGSYEVSGDVTPRSLLAKLVAGDEALARVRFNEGWTFRQVRAELARTASLRPDTRDMSDAGVMTALGVPSQPPEGRFFPDTYTYAKGSSDLAVLARAYRAMQRGLMHAWGERADGLPLANADEVLTLASIIEKETGHADDRGLVAAVFVNRLKLGMPLQTDPTVIYGLGSDFDGNLRKRDLQRDGPYNTYTRVGLPPTPIAMPGRDALLAAVRPAQSKALFFVSRGDGRSEFSETLTEHNRAVNRYQRP
jgi:UPF0755 protein